MASGYYIEQHNTRKCSYDSDQNKADKERGHRPFYIDQTARGHIFGHFMRLNLGLQVTKWALTAHALGATSPV